MRTHCRTSGTSPSQFLCRYSIYRGELATTTVLQTCYMHNEVHATQRKLIHFHSDRSRRRIVWHKVVHSRVNITWYPSGCNRKVHAYFFVTCLDEPTLCLLQLWCIKPFYCFAQWKRLEWIQERLTLRLSHWSVFCEERSTTKSAINLWQALNRRRGGDTISFCCRLPSLT